ncbi:MAG: permease-like cell division protein FtsX [Bacteroidota bacterium]
MALPYALREGLAGFRRASFASLASVSALAVALVLIGMTALVGWIVQTAAEDLRESAGEIEVYLETSDQAETARLRTRLEGLPGTDSLTYISKQEAARIFREAFGEGSDLYDDDATFLPASFRVRFRGAYASRDSLEQTASRVESWQRVMDVGYSPDLLSTIEQNYSVIRAAGLGVGGLVVLAALLLVGNTIRLSIYARRMLIRTMKLVGATSGFIRRPFLVEGGIQGVAAGALAGGALWGLYALLVGFLERSDVVGLGWPGGSPLLTLGFCLVLGLLMGLLASWVAVRRFIREVRLSE